MERIEPDNCNAVVSARTLIACVAPLLVGSCTITYPLVVVQPSGETLRGTISAALGGGSFKFSDGRLTCDGFYNDNDPSRTKVIPAKCSDGRTGIVRSNRDPDDPSSGTGTITVSDGSSWNFGWGKDAAIAEQSARTRLVQESNKSALPTAMASTAPLDAKPSTVVSAPTYAIAMRSDGGTYVVPVTINDAIKLDFVVDSGATDVSIPGDVVLTLIRTGTITKAEFLGSKTYELADGTPLPSPTFRIKSLKMGDVIVLNVTANVAPVRGSLLLGQSFLRRFKSWSIDNDSHVLRLQGNPTSQ